MTTTTYKERFEKLHKERFEKLHKEIVSHFSKDCLVWINEEKNEIQVGGMVVELAGETYKYVNIHFGVEKPHDEYSEVKMKFRVERFFNMDKNILEIMKTLVDLYPLNLKISKIAEEIGNDIFKTLNGYI